VASGGKAAWVSRSHQLSLQTCESELAAALPLSCGMAALKIGLVCDWFTPQIGGIENHISDLAKQLRVRGHAPQVITSTPGPSELEGIPVHRLDVARLPGWRVIGDVRASRRVREICEAAGFDLVHGHSFQSPLAHVAMHVSRELAIPSLLTQHTLLAPAPATVLRWLDRSIGWAAWPTIITGVSSAVADQARVVAGRHDVRVLHTGLDLAAWSRQRTPISRETVVLCVTRFYAHKHADELVHAIPRVLASSRCPGALRFVMVGEGPQRRRLERLARRLGVAGVTEFTGASPRRDVADLLERAHVFVVPNPAEAFGIVALEARAKGLPVVARSSSGTCDVIEHERHGLLCDTIDDMARSIARLCDDPRLREAISERAPEGLEQFGWNHAIERHLALYGEALGRSAGALKRAA
jgi:glycosyltransferase involved in cell wall biosynthesis